MNYLTTTTHTCRDALGNFYHAMITHPYTGVLKTKISEGVNFTTTWFDHGIKAIPTIPSRMQENAGVAFGVIFTANTVFFVIMNSVTNFFNKGIEKFKPEAEMTKGQKWFKKRFLDVVVLGGSVFLFNRFGIPYATGYHLRNWVNAAIAASAIFLREILRALKPSQRQALQNELNQANIAREQAEQARNGLQLHLNQSNIARELAEQQRNLAIQERDALQLQLNLPNPQIKNLENQLAFERDQLIKANTQVNSMQEELSKVQKELKKTIKEKNSEELRGDNYQKQLDVINTDYLNAINEMNDIKKELKEAKIQLDELKNHSNSPNIIEKDPADT